MILQRNKKATKKSHQYLALSSEENFLNTSNIKVAIFYKTQRHIAYETYTHLERSSLDGSEVDSRVSPFIISDCTPGKFVHLILFKIASRRSYVSFRFKSIRSKTWIKIVSLRTAPH